MNRVKFAVLGAITFSATVLLSGAVPGVPSLLKVSSAIAENIRSQSQVDLRLSAEKQVMAQDLQGKLKATWKALEGKAVVQSGDVLKYTLTGENIGDKSVNALTFNQPIPKGMIYVIKSASADVNGAKISFSIDNGRTFVDNPTVQVRQSDGKIVTKPAEASSYTHIRWKFPQSLAAKSSIKGSYQLRVQ